MSAWPAGSGPDPLDGAEATTLAYELQVLADPTRVRILSIAAAALPGAVTVTDLLEPLGLSQSTVSHHLRVLRDAGFLALERSGTWSHYRLKPARLTQLAERLGAPSESNAVPTRADAVRSQSDAVPAQADTPSESGEPARG